MSEEEDAMSRRRFRPDRDVEEAFSDYSADVEPPHLIDFGSVALYVPGLQTTIALGLCCLTAVLTSIASAQFTVSAVRTATLASLVGFVCVWRPIRIAHARGIDVMFDALRPAVGFYMMALILEQLVHSCGPTTDGGLSLRHGVYHASTLLMTAAGFAQAWRPKAQTDYPFVVVALALVTISFFTPPPHAGEGPLCEPPPMVDAIERVFRALLFGCAYCALAYAAEPTRHTVLEVGLCAIRAAAGSSWILCIHRYAMWLALAQATLVLWARVQGTSGGRFSPIDAVEYERARRFASASRTAEWSRATDAPPIGPPIGPFDAYAYDERDDDDVVVDERRAPRAASTFELGALYQPSAEMHAAPTSDAGHTLSVLLANPAGRVASGQMRTDANEASRAPEAAPFSRTHMAAAAARLMQNGGV
jgi:hypothetical protein